MRTIILTSQYGLDVQKEIVKLLPAPPNLMKVAFVYTAKKPAIEKETNWTSKSKNNLIEAGFIVENYDIEGKSTEQVREELKGFDIVFLAGGNTFYLLKAMHEVNFSEIIRELLDSGIIYIGESAGSYVACPDINPTVWKGRTKNDVELKDMTGLYLVDFGVIVHFDGNLPKNVAQEVIKAPYDVKYLRDDQLIYINGKEVSEITAK